MVLLDFEVEAGLEVEPEAVGGAEVERQPQCGRDGDSAAEDATSRGDSSVSGSATSSRRRYASSSWTTSECETTSAADIWYVMSGAGRCP